MSPGERVAQVAHELLDPGPISRAVRVEVYREFILANFTADPNPIANVYKSSGTNCAIFVRGCLAQAGIMPPGKRPAATAITTWIGVRGFVEDDPDTEAIEGAWIPIAELGKKGERIITGDIPYWCSDRGRLSIGGGKFYEWTTWQNAADGHVGLVGFDGEGWFHPTFEGGGANHTCRASAGPKDIRWSSHKGKLLRGVWRPALLAQRLGVQL